MRHRRRNKQSAKTKKTKKTSPKRVILEKTSLQEIVGNRKAAEQHRKWYWAQYCEFAYQRELIKDRIAEALIQACSSEYKIENFQRVTLIQFCTKPLSSLGSLRALPGGRFNISDGLNINIPSFPALYIAKDKDTAIQECFGESLDGALTRPDSIACFRVNGILEKIIDLRDETKLLPFIELIKDFKYSSQLIETSKKLGITNCSVIGTVSQLMEAIYKDDWRSQAALVDIPAPCQIFGQLVHQAKIEGILYTSRFTQKECLAIFPENFAHANLSFIEVADKLPYKGSVNRIDTNNWRASIV